MSEPTSDPSAFQIAELAVPAIVSLLVGLVTGSLSGLLAARLQRERLRTELKLEFSTETAIRELLSDPHFKERKRSFAAIRRRLAGFEDDDLRKHLIRAGAVSFRKRGVTGDEGELWGLRELVDKADVWGSGD